jgi:5-methylcytosine-specific restriction endonuclease McrA
MTAEGITQEVIAALIGITGKTLRKHFKTEIGVPLRNRRVPFLRPQPGQTLYAANRERWKANVRAWQKANPEKHLAILAKRRARKLAVPGSWTADDIRDIRRMQRDRCALCRCALRGKGCRDHIVPLSKGGANDRRNIQLTCRPCNAAKHARDPVEHMRSLGFLI